MFKIILLALKAAFKALYVFLVLSLERRRIGHFNVTDSPTTAWTSRQWHAATAGWDYW